MHTIIHGDCLEELKKLDDNSVDAVITDPPYGLSNTKPAQVADVLKAWVTGDTVSVPAKRGGFMGKDWDSFVPPPAVWEECMRVLKPGGHMAVFAGARTQDLMGLSIRLAGFEIRDTLGWVYGSGFPKSMDVSKAIDKAAGAEREVVGRTKTPFKVDAAAHRGTSLQGSVNGDFSKQVDENGYRYTEHTAPATSEAQRWDGWGTALKPAIEPIILARKPLDGTVANNVLAHGVGGLNIDASRVGNESRINLPAGNKANSGGVYKFSNAEVDAFNGAKPAEVAGRFPANVLLDEHAAKEMDKQSGWQKDGTAVNRNRAHDATPPGYGGGFRSVDRNDRTFGSGGGASRFFPVFKSEGETLETKGRFPANVLLDEHAAKEMDKQSGWLKDRGNKRESKSTYTGGGATSFTGGGTSPLSYGAGGGASRFFPVFKYQAKAPKKERPVIVREDGTKIQHPTVKPLALMEWLITLITPPGGAILDPFAGTGTTLQAATNKGFNPIGVEADTDYIQLIHQRMEGGEQSTRNN